MPSDDELKNEDKGNNSPGAQFYPASNVLKAKAPPIEKNLKKVIIEATDVIEAMTDDYIEWAKGDINRLKEAVSKLKADSGSKMAIDGVYAIAHDMKGQGSSFGYPLITYVLDNLCKFLGNFDKLEKEDVDIVLLHVEFVDVIIANNLTGKGGEMGAAVLKGMQEILAKKV